MSIFKCKMCGGNLEVTGESSVVTCEYCGTSQTISKSRDEVVSNLYNRANDLRIKCEFDRAEQTYEKILEQDNTEAEAHWGIVLCRYGIEYVDDPATSKKIPTCHRTSYEAITSDTDYIAAMQNADSEQKAVYETEARAIDKIQKNILSIVKNEEPFDVFICYKETDENGKRTIDSTIANDIYYQLTQEGFKVFYAPITLEDKLGQEYEPYIFAALNSAKVMLVVGTKPEYFNAVWVKNEWSRFLKLLKADRSKMIIPCYRDMDAYDLPDEFAHLQSQDMSKIGFVNDVVRGIKKVVVKENNDYTTPQISTEPQKPLKTNNNLNNKISNKNSNAAKTFSIISGILFMVSGIAYIYFVLTNYKWQGNGTHLILYYLSQCLFFVLGIFLFKRKQKPITVVWFLCSIGKVAFLCYRVTYGYSLSPTIHIIIITIVLLLFMLLNIFKKNLLKHIWVQIVAFILPVAYAFCSLLGGFSIFELVNIGFGFLAMIFYLLYLISENKVRKPE